MRKLFLTGKRRCLACTAESFRKCSMQELFWYLSFFLPFLCVHFVIGHGLILEIITLGKRSACSYESPGRRCY